MSDILHKIQQRLDSKPVDQNLGTLFIQDLRWARAPSNALNISIPKPANTTLCVSPIAQMAGLPVFRIDWPEDRLPTVTARRAVQRELKPKYAEHLICYVTRDKQQLAFVWARRRPDGAVELRTLPYEVGSPARTTIERLAGLAFTIYELTAGPPSITNVTDKLNRAFDVEAVTRDFFDGFQTVFDELQSQLRKRCQDPKWAHDYALQLLSRILFLYFIQRKRWLGDDPHFLRSFWDAYKQHGQAKDTFFSQWLSVLFFEAFNRRFHGGHQYFPNGIRQALQLAPYLNGGLFTQNQLDSKYTVTVPDEFFGQLFDQFDHNTPGFFERYNFTISESTPLNIEVAVDPEMIGKVYESLVNITSEGIAAEDRRGRAGIFYTPRIEIDLMCRLALVDALANRLGQQHRALLYDWVFAHDLEQKDRTDQQIAKRNLWPTLNQHLREITVCDPACGSGSFLVGMLLVLDDLQARANLRLGIEETAYQRRRRIIGEQLYGVDVMGWAVHVAELRLWLQLVVETELKPQELTFRPLLPNLSFKIRQGDSLIQEIGGLNFALHHRRELDLPAHLKGRITQLKGEKLRYYQGEPSLCDDDLKQQERRLFRDILDHKRPRLEKEIAALTRKLQSPAEQGQLSGITSSAPNQQRLKLEAQWRSERDEKQAELGRIGQALDALRTAQSIPFVWDIAFVEIFEGDKQGFDIVIGNPPYVRQEMIAPPTLDPAQFGGENSADWKQHKKAYKEKLQLAVAATWPKFFRYGPTSGAFRKPDGKSDLYIYFYFLALRLLHPGGAFCFITSNSWLDVGYGADLQEFLLRHSHVKLIMDNQVKRSFAQADVNTVIVLLARPDDSREDGLDKIARFVMFRKPFEEAARAEVFKAIESAGDRQSTDEYRVNARFQRELLEEGLEIEPHEADQPAPKSKNDTSGRSLIKTAPYIGNKWGGKYLRAPDIFFTILEKGKGKLVRLGDIAEVRRGFTTGANEFFYLEPTGTRAPKGYLHVRNSAGWEGEIEKEFLRPVIKSPRECRSIVIKPEDLRYKIFMCHRDKADLKGTAALEYIRWGETQGYHQRPSCRGRRRWWDVGVREFGKVVWPMIHNDRPAVFWNGCGVAVDHNLFEILGDHPLELWASLASSPQIVFRELYGRSNLGEGALKTEGIDIRKFEVIRPEVMRSFGIERLEAAFEQMSKRLIQPLEIEIHQPDRRALDDVVFEVLGLTKAEREAVYEAVVELVRARLEKAQNV